MAAAQSLRLRPLLTPALSSPKPSPSPRRLPLLPVRRVSSLISAAAALPPDAAVVENGILLAGAIDVDAVSEAELKENGFRSTRRTKLVCTIGPATCGDDQLEALAVGGMNVARLNMCHGVHAWHRDVIRRVRTLNEEKGFAVAVMMDTEGSEIHMGDLPAPVVRAEEWSELCGELLHGCGLKNRTSRRMRRTLRGEAAEITLEWPPQQGSEMRLTVAITVRGGRGRDEAILKDGEIWTFTVRQFASTLPDKTISVNYDGFAEDVRIGDELLVDGGMVRFDVIEKIGPDVKCSCTDPGLLLPRANLTFWRDGSLVRERNAMLPTISSKDWLDIDFGIAEGVDFIAVSFVKSAEVINHLKSYIAARSRERDIAVIAKIESTDSLRNLEEIILASDGAMVARGDLGAQIPLEQVPSEQQRIVKLCRQLNKPVIVASQLLESMIEYPTPTRAEVADVSEAVRQRADALMLSGESAMGQYPEKALSVLRSVSLRIERWWREEKQYEGTELQHIASTYSDQISEEICNSAAKMANNLGVDAIFVFAKTGHMASLVSRCRPDCPIFAFTTATSVRRRLNLQWGLIPFRIDFSDDMESNLNRTFSLLKARGMIQSGDLVIAVSDMLQSIQVMKVS